MTGDVPMGQVARISSLQSRPFDTEQRRVDGFSAADRATARPTEALSFLEDKPALRAFRRLDEEASSGSMQGLADVLQMAGDIFLGNADETREVESGQRSLFEFRHDLVTHCFHRL